MLRTDSHQAPVIERAKRFATNAMACSDCGMPWENCRAFSENAQRYDSQPWTTWRWYKIALWQPQQWPVETPRCGFVWNVEIHGNPQPKWPLS
jgi:hypothetical protein